MAAVELAAPATDIPRQLAGHQLAAEVGRHTAFAYRGGDVVVPLDVLVERAGFAVRDVTAAGDEATRARALPDTVGPDMQLLLVGLNPSLHAADAGYGFAGPGNRFWPAATAAGVVSAERDGLAVLTDDGIGMTDIVKRPSRRAAELTTAEYRAGFDRLEQLCAWLAPRAVCFVGLTGYRTARDRRAVTGLQSEPLAGSPVYVMPNPSGLNAHTNHADLIDHFGKAMALAEGGTSARVARDVRSRGRPGS